MEEKRARKNSKQQPEDPRAKIRIVPGTVSNAMLFKRLDCAEGEHLFTYAEEIDTLSKGRKSGAWSQKDDIMRQAFDNSICGQDYMSGQLMERDGEGVLQHADLWHADSCTPILQ